MLVRAKKSLGQNYLIDENILKEIVNLGNIDSESQVIEIGPGTGNLTKEIVKKNPKHLILIEKDRFLIDKLRLSNLTINEFNEIVWDASEFQSGLYFAEISPNIGESAIVRVVVVK